MKKQRIIFAIKMILLIAATVTVSGASYSQQENKRGQSYDITATGERTTFRAISVANQGTCYTTLYNDSNIDSYLSAYTWEYTHSTGWTGVVSDSGTIESGKIVDSGKLQRQVNSDIVEYHHKATCYANQAQMGTIDTFVYIADQYYD